MVAAGESPTQVGLEPAPREGLLSFYRRWRRSLSRHRGMRYVLLVYGPAITAGFLMLFVICGFALGWRPAYDVTVQILSPWETRVPPLAMVLSLAGFLAIPALVGGVVGQAVVETTENRGSRRRERGRRNFIPLLGRLLYAGHGFNVRPTFPEEFVGVHVGNWNIAQNHWEILVGEFLNTASADLSHASDREVLVHAVNTAAALLPEPVVRCPQCPQPNRDSTNGGEPS